MLLLTGATGLVGSALLRRLLAEATPVRCLVRDPRRLGARACGCRSRWATSPTRRRFAMRCAGCDTVVHLGGLDPRPARAARSRSSTAIATWRMVQAAERAGVERFLFFSVLGASTPPPRALLPRKGAGRAGGARGGPAHDRVRALDRLRPGRPLADAAGAPGATAGDAGLRARPCCLPADLGGGRGRLRDRRRCARDERRAAASATSSPAPRRSATPTSCAWCCARRAAAGYWCTCPTPVVSRALRLLEAAMGSARLCHLGRGRADGGADDLRPRHRRCRAPWRDAASRWRRSRRLVDTGAGAAAPTAARLRAGRRARAAGLACRAPDELHGERQAVLALEQRHARCPADRWR